MDKEEKILNYISKNQNISQRQLSLHTGLSLGSINLIIKKMVKKGLVKVERINTNTLKYALTPKGFTEKTMKTYRYILDSVRHVLLIKQELEWIVEKYISDGYSIYLYGDKDDIQDVLKQLAQEGELKRLEWITNVDGLLMEEEIRIKLIEKRKVLIVVWQLEKEKELCYYNNKHNRYGIEVVNLLNKIV